MSRSDYGKEYYKDHLEKWEQYRATERKKRFEALTPEELEMRIDRLSKRIKEESERLERYKDRLNVLRELEKGTI